MATQQRRKSSVTAEDLSGVVKLNSLHPEKDVSEYINYAQSNTSFSDITLRMGRVIDADKGEAESTLNVYKLVEITFSPLQAHIVGQLLIDSASRFQEIFGQHPLDGDETGKDDEEPDGSDAP